MTLSYLIVSGWLSNYSGIFGKLNALRKTYGTILNFKKSIADLNNIHIFMDWYLTAHKYKKHAKCLWLKFLNEEIFKHLLFRLNLFSIYNTIQQNISDCNNKFKKKGIA